MNPIPTLLSATIATLASVGLAQDGGGDGGGKGATRKVRYEHRDTGLHEIRTKDDGFVYERQLEKAEIRRLRESGAITIIKANALCTSTTHTKPRRLTAGGSGTLKVLVSLAGDVVVLPGTSVGLELQPIPGFTLGRPVLATAQTSRNPGRYRGKPVHDDYLLFDVPVRVASDVAPNPKIPVEGTITMGFHDGTTGEDLGRYFADITGRVSVGVRVPRAAPRISAPPPGPRVRRGGERRGSNPEPATGQPSGTRPGRPPSGTSGAREPTRGATPSSTAGDPPPPAGSGSRGEIFTWLVGAVVVLLLWLLLGRRE
jgi:hypothetical protein